MIFLSYQVSHPNYVPCVSVKEVTRVWVRLLLLQENFKAKITVSITQRLLYLCP